MLQLAIHFGALICAFDMLDAYMKSAQRAHHFLYKNRISCTLGHSCTYDGTGYSSDAHVTVPCAPGERFNDGLEVVRSVCSSRRGWQPDIHACAGTSCNIQTDIDSNRCSDVCQTRSYIELLVHVELFGGSIAFGCRHFCFDKTTLKCRRCESADLFTFASTGRIVIPTNAQNTSTIDVPFNVSPQRHRVCKVMHTICCHVLHHSRVSLYVAITSFSIQLRARTIRGERCHDTK